jgi:hypothetical protein
MICRFSPRCTAGPGVLAAALLLLLSCGQEMIPDRPAATGTIRGRLSFPSEYLPAQRLVAYDADSMIPVAWTDTRYGQSSYALAVPPGSYFVVAYSLESGHEQLACAWTKYAQVGGPYGYDDHSLIRISVVAGETVEGVDPVDWYAPAGTLPGRP